MAEPAVIQTDDARILVRPTDESDGVEIVAYTDAGEGMALTLDPTAAVELVLEVCAVVTRLRRGMEPSQRST